jgi:ADP-ribosylglycohydrolase
MRKQYILLTSLLLFSMQFFAQSKKMDTNFLQNKIKELLLGSCIGDALGGPIEFQGHPEIQATPNPPKLWTDSTDLINEVALKAARERLYLREYKHLRPLPEPYAHWTSNAAPGTVTDDSRHKFILLYMLKKAVQKNQFPVTEISLANAYLDWSKSKTIKTHSGYDTLCKQWLDESYKAIHWLKGSRKIGEAYPVERLWNALPTCYGQMSLTPLAALFPGVPIEAYKMSYHLAYFDNAFAKDMNAAIVAGLAYALTLDPTKKTNKELWTEVLNTIRTTDPYDYAKVPWSERATNKWLDLADLYVKEANGSPYKLFERLEKELIYNIKWEAEVPFVVIFSCLKMCNYDPLAALQMSIEWGWDHDSYAQLLGAFIGAIYGISIFPKAIVNTVEERLQLDYDENSNEWITMLQKVRFIGAQKKLFKIR